jgi:hydroxymethylpyrimidine/phosphomethylpyrimidine kinase
MCFNASDPSGAGGLAGDIATIAAMGAHALPIVTTIVMRDTAEVFDQHRIDADVVAEQARTVLEDVTLAGWKVGFLVRADIVSAVAEVLSDYTEIPLVSYMPNLAGWTRTSCSPTWTPSASSSCPPPRCWWATTRRCRTSCCPTGTASARPRRANWRWPPASTARATCWSPASMLASKGSEQFIDNVLASPQGALTGEKFERFDAAFVGAGDTLARRWRRCWPPAASCRPPWPRR